MHAIDGLAQFASEHPMGSLSAQTRETCSLLVLDLIAAAAAGHGSDLATAARATAASLYGSGPATVWFSTTSSSMAAAAVANAAAASALDIDDGHRGAAGHPGAAVIPTALAVAQAIKASDEQIFDAIAIGYDVGLRIASSRPTPTIDTYASGRWGSYGAAATAGRLLGLNPRQMAHALAIAGAEGPICFPKGSSIYQGSTVKEVIPPAVHAGLTGALRAKNGATGPRDLLDREDLFERSVLTGQMGNRWWLADCYLKPYACCRYMHAAIDAITALKQPGSTIRHLRVETFPRALGLVNERRPKTLEGAQYSFYFSCALAAIHGAEALQPIDPERLTDEQVLELSSRIELAAADEFASSFPAGTPCRVILDQGNGTEQLTVLSPLGDVSNPMSRQQVIDKFVRVTAHALSEDVQETIIAAIKGLGSGGFTPLLDALRPTVTR